MIDKRSKKLAPSKIFAYVTLTLACLLVLFPFLVIIITSLKTYADSVKVPFDFFPDNVNVEAYKEVLSMSSLWRGLGNTMIIVLPIMIIGVFNSSLAAYAFAKIKFKGKGIAFTILMFSMMLPGVITMTPAYVIYDTLGWTDTYVPLMLPNAFGTVACMFYLRQYFRGIPKEMLEAAEIDGLGRFGIFMRIILPLSKPAIVAQLILWLIAGYNDYFGPMLYLDSERKYTLQLVLKLMTGSAESNWPKIMAACVVAMIPMLVIYLVAQKQFIEGIVSTGLKD
ncbi:MAG: carbohydrate ABC transporter permease [Clostridia bacterium]|nr:carbohydrate ABC transporter permease [Clostridia bacterium]